MINVGKITTALYGLVGFRQPFNVSYAKLDAANQVSRSGYFITDNPFAKLEFIYDSQDLQTITDANFNLWLKRKQQESITSVCNAVFNEADFIDRQVLYKHAQNKVNTETLPEGFIGFRIKVSDEKNIAFSIKRVLLGFSGTGAFDLHLFNTSKSAPIKTKSINVTGSQMEVQLDWYIDNTDGYYKGDYYLGYINSGLAITPFKRDYELSNIRSVISYLCIEPISVSGVTSATLWNLTDNEGLSEDTGLNPDITVYEDFTDLVINNEMLFARAISLDLTIAMLSEYAASLRSNKNERDAGQKLIRITQEVEGQSGEGLLKITGLRPQLYRSIATIKNEIKKLKAGYFGDGLMIDTLN